MKLVNPNHVFILLMITAIVLLSLLTAILSLTLPDNLPDSDDNASSLGNFLIAWRSVSAQDLALELILGMSVFILFVTYLGGRSNRRRFNDRIPDSNFTSKNVWLFLKTASSEAVFNFLFSGTLQKFDLRL